MAINEVLAALADDTRRKILLNQRNVKTLSTAELLGIGSRSVSFKRPIPIDTINKYWGIDSIKNKNEKVVQKQAYRRNYEKFY